MAERAIVRHGQEGHPKILELEVAASTTIEKGKIVCLNASGYAVEGSDALGLRAMGVAQYTVANAGANGAEKVIVECGILRIDNSTTSAVTRADLGELVYIEDDETVRSGNDGTSSAAGFAIKVDSDGVYVRFPAFERGALRQTGTATLASGTITIDAGITLTANSSVIVQPVGAITGSTNFACCHELEASRVVGPPGTAEMVLQALGANGALDADAAGDVRWTILD